MRVMIELYPYLSSLKNLGQNIRSASLSHEALYHRGRILFRNFGNRTVGLPGRANVSALNERMYALGFS